MIALLCSLALAGPQVRFDRVDLVSEDPGLWVNHDLPRLGLTPRTVAVRWVTQIKPVIAIGDVQIGASLASQSVVYDRLLWARGSWELHAHGGLQTQLLLPRGGIAGASAHWRGLRLGLGTSVLSSATWARPNWSTWSVLPTLAIGVGPGF